jgi:protein-S-isoprenylcysteine O-methyltransferase Ste14
MRGDRTRQGLAVLGSIAFFFAAPGTVVALVPWWLSGWRIQAMFPGASVLRFVGAILVITGILVLMDSFARFALHGLGTPAPVSPPRRLVTIGLYRYVRNPIYLGVVSGIVGQALLFGSLGLLAYGGLVAITVHLFVVGYEEPKLRATFGDEYDAFCANVPRWLPRLRPWAGQA